MKKSILIIMMALAILISCGNKGQQQPTGQSEEQHYYILRDTTIYGYCAEGSAMNTLQIITDTGDTITLSTARAQEQNCVLGGYAVGDEIAVVANADTTQALLVVNKSMLNGEWVMPNPLDGSDEVGIRILRGGAAESIDQSTIIYKNWRLFNGQLQFTATREDGIDMEELMVFDIVKLTADSLVLKDEEDTYEYGHPGPSEYDDMDDIELDDGMADEFNM